MKKKILIVGAGITGATIARLLADTDKYEIEVVDDRKEIGGACHDCIKHGAYYQSHGAHIFNTTNERVWHFVNRFTKWHPFHHKVEGLINGIYVPLPINLNSLDKLFNKTAVMAIEAALINEGYHYYSEIKLKELRESKNEVLAELGNVIYLAVFKQYSLKQWGTIPCEDVINRVKAFRYSRDDRYFITDFQGIPEKGYTQMIKNMLNHKNIKVRKRTKVTLQGLKDLKFDKIFFSGAVDEFADYIYGQLNYRSCKFEASLYNGRYIQSAPVINYPNSYKFTRCHDYSYFMPSCKNGYFVKEYPAKFEPNKGLERYYPIDEKLNLKRYEHYTEYIKKQIPQICFVGRLGAFKYVSMDKAIENAIETLIKEKM